MKESDRRSQSANSKYRSLLDNGRQASVTGQLGSIALDRLRTRSSLLAGTIGRLQSVERSLAASESNTRQNSADRLEESEPISAAANFAPGDPPTSSAAPSHGLARRGFGSSFDVARFKPIARSTSTGSKLTATFPPTVLPLASTAHRNAAPTRASNTRSRAYQPAALLDKKPSGPAYEHLAEPRPLSRSASAATAPRRAAPTVTSSVTSAVLESVRSQLIAEHTRVQPAHESALETYLARSSAAEPRAYVAPSRQSSGSGYGSVAHLDHGAVLKSMQPASSRARGSSGSDYTAMYSYANATSALGDNSGRPSRGGGSSLSASNSNEAYRNGSKPASVGIAPSGDALAPAGRLQTSRHVTAEPPARYPAARGSNRLGAATSAPLTHIVSAALSKGWSSSAGYPATSADAAQPVRVLSPQALHPSLSDPTSYGAESTPVRTNLGQHPESPAIFGSSPRSHEIVISNPSTPEVDQYTGAFIARLVRPEFPHAARG